MVRGLDYYTGTIYETIIPNSSVGAIAAGGRYDKLINSFSKMNIPCVGISIGFERIFIVLEEQQINKKSKADIMVVTCGKVNAQDKKELVQQLRNSEFRVIMELKKKAKTLDQFQFAEDNNIPLCVILGQSEISQNIYKLRRTKTRKEISVNKENIVDYCILELNP